MASTKPEIHGPLLLVLSSPSGGGKSTLCRELVRRHPDFHFSVSATTRRRAPGERHGRNYYYLTEPEFKAGVRRGEFVEWARVYGHYYGTLVSEIARALKQGRVILFDVDARGGMALKRAYPEAVTVFVLPPSLTELKRRLTGRHRDSPAEIQRRLAAALKEMRMKTKYDYNVQNKSLREAVHQLEVILEAESLKPGRHRSG